MVLPWNFRLSGWSGSGRQEFPHLLGRSHELFRVSIRHAGHQGGGNQENFRSRQSILLENAALRHQIEVLQRNSGRPDIRWRDRAFWDLLSCIWTDWRKSLFIVQPETVIRWHRQGFRLYWKWLSRPRRPGRPYVSREIRELIRQMSLANHSIDIASIDFFTVPTVTFQVIYVFLVLDNARRRILHFNVTRSPTAAWTGQQVVEAYPWDTAPRFLLRDRDGY